MPPNNPSGKRHKRNRSSGDLTKDQIDELSALLDVIENQVQELKSNKKYGDLEEVQQLVNETQAIFAQVKWFQLLKLGHPDAVIVSLSSMDHDTLKDRLGMGDPISVETGDKPQDFLVGIHKALKGYKKPCDIDIIVETVAAWDCAYLFSLLTTYTTNINDRSEAAARMIIDPWIISGMQLVETISAKYRIVLLPELLVCSSRSQNDLPAIIEYDKNVTFLAGSIDYVTLNYHLPSTSYDDRYLERTLEIDDIVKGENAARALRIFTNADTLTICEAKRKSRKLYDHEPQVVAECLALLSKLKTSRPSGLNREFSTTKVGFTLTTGVAWVFGLVDMKERQYMKTEEIKINVNARTGTEAYQSLRALMTLMLIWGTQSGDVLETIMASMASSGVGVNSSVQSSQSRS